MSLLGMARAAQHDDRLADGALYGKLADEIERLREIIRLANINLCMLLPEIADRYMAKSVRETLDMIDDASAANGEKR
jgi:hypothetical protein